MKLIKNIEDLTIYEKIVYEALSKMNYINYRLLGAIEAVLVIEGVLTAGEKFNFQDVKEKIFFGLINTTRKQYYHEFIKEHAIKYLVDNNIIG